MASISFIYPMYLLFLLLIPLFIFIHFITLKATRSTALRFANFEAIAKIKSVDFFSKNLIILFLSILIVFVLVMALSGLTLHTIAEASKHSFVIALDMSESMGAKDMSPNRLEAAKQVGQLLAQICKEKKITNVIFDRNGFLFHGRVKALAEAAREGGLIF